MNSIIKNIIKAKRFYAKIVVVFMMFVMVVIQINVAEAGPAGFNTKINYQGKLTNASNVAVSDGVYHMRFKLYTASTGGVAIWTDDRSTAAGDRITVTNGLFSAMLGSSTPLTSVDFNQTLYLGVEIGGSGGAASWDGEMTPRKVLGAVPAAFVADTLDNISSEQFLRADASNATSTATSWLSFVQNGAGKIAEFFGPSSASVLSILSGGNVGIGTTSPYAKLAVTGQVVANNFFATSSNSTNVFMGTTTIGTATSVAKLTVEGNGDEAGIFSSGIYQVELADLTDQRAIHATDNSGNIAILADNAGGTGVSGTGLVYGVKGENNSASGYGIFSRQTNGAGYSGYFLGGQNYFEGNVGIGTTSPYAKLSVVGQVVASYFTATTSTASTFPYASTTALTVSGTGGLQLASALNGPLQANGGLVSATSSIGVLYGGTGLTSAPTYGQMLVGNSSSGYTLTATSSLGLLASTKIGEGTIGQIPYYALNGNTLAATSGVFITTSGNVGVGSTSPANSSKFGVAGNSYFAGTITTTGAIASGAGITAVGNIILDASADRTIGFNAAQSSSVLTISGANGFETNPGAIKILAGSDTAASAAGANVYIAGGTGGSDGNVILGSNGTSFIGNVGIGTTSPYAKLSVVGQIVGSYFTATTSTASTFPYASTTMITATTASTTNLTVSGISACSGSNALTTNASGVVACGAISGGAAFPFTPATNYGVNTSATSTALWAQAGIMASSTSYFVNASTTNFTVASNAYFSGGFWDSNGYVGIGTTTPDTKLTVFGGISAVGSLGSNLVTNGTFTTDLTGWSGTNWSQSSGGALHTAGSIAPLLSSTFTSTIGETYRVDFDIVGASAGYGKMYFAGNYGKDAIGNGTFTEYITAATTTGFMFYPETDFNGRIDNVSIRLLTTTATSTIETPIEFRKKIIVDDRIEFPMGKPVIIGYGALPNNEKGTYNISSSNVCIGYEACKNVKTGQVTAIGYQAGRSADYDLGSDFEASLTAVGKWAGYANTSGHASFFGNAAGRSNTTAVSHCFGDESCAHVTTGAVSAFGSYSLYENIAGFSAAFGKNAGRNGTTTIGASYFGEDAGYNNFQGLVTIMGYQAAYNNTYGEPTVFGYQSGYQNTIGQITGFGTYAGYRNTTGRLIAIGRYAGADGTNGPRTDTGGILIGDNATRGVGFATQLTNYVGIGDAVSVDKSNQVVLGNSSIVETILRGKVGIGTSTPYATLSVVGQTVGSYFTATTSTASTFPYASTTMITATTASTTNLTISGISACSGSNALTTNASGVVACGAISGGGGTYPFTPATNYGVTNSATSSVLWAQAGINASSTSHFVNASTTNLTVESNAYFAGTGIWDSSGHVGISTVSPTAQLEIAGVTSGTPAILVIDGANEGTLLSLTGDTDSENVDFLVGDTLHSKTFELNAADGVAKALFTGVNVGIGSSTPWAKLSVGSANATTQFPLFSVASSSAAVATSTAFTINWNGNVGIGTTSPASKLSFVASTASTGGISFGDDALLYRSAARILTTNADINMGSVYLQASGKIYASEGIWNLTSGNNSRFVTSDTGITATRDVADANVALLLTQANSGSTGDILRLANSGGTVAEFTQSGSLGIGTTSPYAKLSVVGQVVASYFTATTSTASTFPYASTTMITATTASTTNLTISGISACSGSSALTTNSSGVVACGAISGGAAFPFTPATNFGVNTSATSTPIWAQAGIMASSTSYFPLGTWNTSGFLGVGTTTPWGMLSVNGNALGDAPQFVVGSSTATSFMVNNGGRVMIGTTTTSSTDKLSINGGNMFIRSLTPQFVLVDTAVVDSNFGMRTQSGTANFFRANNDSSLSAFLISFNLANARVGIATTTPVYKLTSFSTSESQLALSAGGGISQWAFRNAGGNLYFATTTVAGTATTSTTALTIIGASGNVGVSTSSPWRTFSVNGTVAMNGLTASATGNAVCITTGKDVTDAGGGTCTPSSIRFKENIETLSSGSALEKIAQMRVVNFDYKEGSYSPEDGPHSVGLIAEEVELIDPKLVDYGYDGQPLTLHFERLTGLSIQAIQELATRVSALEAQTASVSGTMPPTQSMIDSLMNHLDGMGASIGDGFAQFKKLVSESLTVGSREKPTGITLYDEVTGDPYCLKISNGKTKTEAGECGSVESEDTGAGSDTTTSQTQNPQDGEGEENSGENSGGSEVTPSADEKTQPQESESTPPDGDAGSDGGSDGGSDTGGGEESSGGEGAGGDAGAGA